eukprot:TRINITY_DN37690_c0_g1_i1.p1 TRINITY_DN37690_c0_g1~~TRINITY_DN37690_c0_g1_i1.p1  ORF type:complete len:508 (-),score=110.82 TRINITY_DN37690_c0_g1_i1:123-1646(-)
MSIGHCPAGSSLVMFPDALENVRFCQSFSQKHCKRSLCHEIRCISGFSQQSRIFKNAFTKPLGNDLFNSRKSIVQTKVNATTEFSDSNSDAINEQQKDGCHPFEALDSDKTDKALRLTDAEIARTIVEVNSKAIIMSSKMILKSASRQLSLPPVQYHYVTDEYGDIYFQVNNDEDVLQCMSTSNCRVHCLIGLENIEIFKKEETSAGIDSDFLSPEASYDTESDDEGFYDEFWNRLVSIVEELDETDLEEPLGGWTNVETMKYIDPMEFSTTLAEVASTDYSKVMDKPSKGLLVVGLMRPAFMEEQSDVHKSLYVEGFPNKDMLYFTQNESKQFGESDVDTNSDSESESQKRHTDSGQGVNDSDTEEELETGTSLYKLEILKIYLVSHDGSQSDVSLEDFQQAEPDILAHSGSNIIARISASGYKAKVALMSLCERVKGIQVQEATLVGIDRLGIDVRVRCGTRLQTLRFAFESQATSEYAAERQLQHLLFPQLRSKRRKRREARRQ